MRATRKKPATSSPARGARKVAGVRSVMAQAEIPYLAVTVREHITEASMVRVFEAVRDEVVLHHATFVLVDFRESSVSLTISDLLGAAKLTASTFAGILQRLAILLRPQDLLDEKFFEPSLRSRGVLTIVTSDAAEALYWLTSKGAKPR